MPRLISFSDQHGGKQYAAILLPCGAFGIIMTEQTSQTSRLAAIPRKTWMIIGGVIAIVIAGALLVTVVLPGITRPFVTLETSRPSYVHPDGMVLTLPNGLQSARVRVVTTPREVFISNPGSEWQ